MLRFFFSPSFIHKVAVVTCSYPFTAAVLWKTKLAVSLCKHILGFLSGFHGLCEPNFNIYELLCQVQLPLLQREYIFV